jgi:predicted transcriptional regulator
MKTSRVGKDKLENMFLHEKPAKLLIRIKEGDGKKYASILSKEVDCTYSHCIRILQEMNKLGLITFKKGGRTKRVQMTKAGEDIAFALENVFRLFERLSD